MPDTVEDEAVGSERMTTVTLSIDVPRHRYLKRLAAVTRLSMSEITRIALDRLRSDLLKIDPDERKAMALLSWAGEGTSIPRNRGRPSKKAGGKSESKKSRKSSKKQER
jgi:hypothetical protein